MKTRNNKFRFAVLTAAVLMSTSFIIAQGPGRGNGPKKGQNMQQAECRLPDLTEEQQEQIKTLKLEHRAEVTKQRADLEVLRAELKQLTVADTPDDKKVFAKVDEITAQKGEMMKAAYKHRQEVRNLLTEEQRIIFDAHSGKGFGKHGRAPGHGKGVHAKRAGQHNFQGKGNYSAMN